MDNNRTYIQTISGLQPNQNTTLEFDISTQAAEKFIRGLFKDLTEGLKRAKAPNVPALNYNDIRVLTMSFSKSFAPFLLILPDAIVDGNEYDPKTPSMFQNVDGAMPIIKEYFELIRAYTYKDNDINDAREKNWVRRQLGMERQDVNEFVYYAKFRNKPLGHERDYDNCKLLFIEIDPGRVFREMLRNQTAMGQRFDITINEVIFTGGNSAIYKVKRTPTNRKGKDQKRFRDRVAEALANSVNL